MTATVMTPASVTELRTNGSWLKIVPETGTCGASIHGLDLRTEQPEEIKAGLVKALHEYGVLFVRFDGAIDPDDHKRVARIFGELRESPFNKGDIPLVSVLDNEKVAAYRTDFWHTDGTILPEPPGAASLRAVKLPAIGGDTMWASMYAAYASLSRSMQLILEGLEAVHSTEKRAHPAGVKSATHPVVIRDPVTNRPALFVNRGYTDHIVGLSEKESACLLQFLYDHVNSPEFHVRLKWDLQTIAIWDELVTQHRAIDDYSGRRILHRVVMKGGRPEAHGEALRSRAIA
jgi:taurine dioxygenase